jgi:ABC-type microcin C transport system permease subunit YejB
MFKYFLRRLLIIIPTLLGVTLVVFFIINLAPGGPIEQKLQQLRFGSGQAMDGGSSSKGNTQGVSDEVMEALKKQYGFDQPLHMRYLLWLKNLSTLNFGESFIQLVPSVTSYRKMLFLQGRYLTLALLQWSQTSKVSRYSNASTKPKRKSIADKSIRT